MISVITCIKNHLKYESTLVPSLDLANKFLSAQNLPELDIIALDGERFKNISQAYNFGISKTKFNLKVFVHDDMDLLLPTWITKIALALSNPVMGLLGVVGTPTPSYTADWWNQADIYGRQYVREEKALWTWIGVAKQGVTGIKFVDGCFLATNRDIHFNEDIYVEGLFVDAYDHTLCLDILNRGLKIGVINHDTWHRCGEKSNIFNYPEKSEELFKKLIKYKNSLTNSL